MSWSTLGQLYQQFCAPLDAKIGGVKLNRTDNWWQPWHYLTAPLGATEPRLRTTDLKGLKLSGCDRIDWFVETLMPMI